MLLQMAMLVKLRLKGLLPERCVSFLKFSLAYSLATLYRNVCSFGTHRQLIPAVSCYRNAGIGTDSVLDTLDGAIVDSETTCLLTS
jgi:hypothetical protein